MSSICPSCCIRCRTEPPSPSSSSAQNPYDLVHLLKAGVIFVKLGQTLEPDAYCEHQHTSDGWHPFKDATPFLPLTNLNDIDLCKELEFLIKYKFISVTYRIWSPGTLILRIYLLPYDLSGAKGGLRVRPENVLAPAKRHLNRVLKRVYRDEEGWNGEGKEGTTPFLQDTTDPRTLAELYSDQPSPEAIPIPGLGDIARRLLDYDDNLDGLGLRSKLYRYQRRSVATMIRRELDLQDIDDPLYVPMTTVDGREFFFQPGTMEVLLERPQVAPCRGGILCEELGTGKTVMIISLILATLRQLPRPEESLIDDRPILTPLSLRYFPSTSCTTARSRLSYKGKERESRVPSLVELLIERSRTAPCEDVPTLSTSKGISRAMRLENIEDDFENLPLAALRDACTPFYHHYLGDPTDHDRDRRKRATSAPKRIYLSPATLVVVPPNLLSQWDREIIKHSEYPLRVKILRDKSDMPSVKSLASDFDIVLTTYTRFTREAKGPTSRLHSTEECKCPEIPGSSVPNCECFVAGVSPLLQIRWKRLVIDEGHVSSSVTTELVPCTKALSIERRWIVTGTPTTNLLGLALGQRTVTEETDEFSMEVDSASDEPGPNSSFVSDSDSMPQLSVFDSLESQGASQASSLRSTPNIADPPKARVWDNDDRGDLRKLGNMITHFIEVPQFAADSRLMATHVTDALLDPHGPRPGAIQVLTQLMQTVMIRHRIEDIEDDVILPPLKHESVLLDMDPLAIKSYNALQASIAVNAVDSERKDQDYLFHPANADLLQVTVKNMSQIMFWSVDDNRYFVDELHKNAVKHMERAISRNRPPEDIELLRNAFRHIALAVGDTTWRMVQGHEDVPYRVYSFPPEIFNAWTRVPASIPDSLNPTLTGFLSADRLLRLYQQVLEKPLTSVEGMIEKGRLVSHEDAAARQAYLDSQNKKSRSKSTTTKLTKDRKDGEETRFQGEASSAHSQIATSAVKKASAKETMDAVKAELKSSMARLDAEAEMEEASGESPVKGKKGKAKALASADAGRGSTRLSTLAHNSALAHVRVGSSASNKLNYIIDQVLKYSDKEKFLIFTDSELTLAHLSEAMDLIHVRHLRFSTQIPARNREQLVLTFETSETFRVFLMELKHGARGLNLVSASRVIFCEPVWQADVESQAIKRVHRIGQTKPITVKTLAIRGTAEENMVIRRHAPQQNSHEKLPKLIEEAGMRHFISNPKFIEAPPTMVSVDFPLLDLPPLDLSNSVTLKLKKAPSAPASPKKRKVWLMDPLSGHDAGLPPPDHDLKRPRTIRFAT